MFELKCINTRRGSTVPIELSLLNLRTNQYVNDFTDYNLVLQIVASDQETILKSYNGSINTSKQVFECSIPFTDTQDLPTGDLYWKIVVKYPVNQQEVLIGEFKLDWGENS